MKPTLLDLREEFCFTIVELADVAEVETQIVYCMLIGRPVSRWQAKKVLLGFKRLSGKTYRLEDISVNLIQPDP
jgi:hypothetical protein